MRNRKRGRKKKDRKRRPPLQRPPTLKVCGFPTNTVLAVHRYADNVEEVYRPLLS